MKHLITICIVIALTVSATVPVSAYSGIGNYRQNQQEASKQNTALLSSITKITQLLRKTATSLPPLDGLASASPKPLAVSCSAGYTETGNYEWNHASVNLSGATNQTAQNKNNDAYVQYKGTIQFSFYGDAVIIVYHYFWRSPSSFTVTIDGVNQGTVNTSGSDENTIRYWQSPTLARGTHAVVMTYLPVYHTTFSGYKSQVCTDVTPPTISVTLTPSGWTNQPVTARSTASDPGSGVAHNYCRLNGEGWTDAGAGTCTRTASSLNTFYYYAVDNIGNTSIVASTPINIETTPPSATPSKSPASTWANQNVTVTASPSDAGGSGVAHTYCKLTSEITWIDSGASACQRTATATTTFQYYVVDGAGNSYGSSASPSTYPVNIEKISPVASATKNPADEWSGPSVDVTATAVDSGGSGVAHIYCRLEGEASYTDSGTGPCTRTGITTFSSFQYYAVDNAGNTHGTAFIPLVLTVWQDNTPPSVQVFIPSTPGLIYTASWMAIDGQTTIREYSVKYLDQNGTWQYPLTSSHALQLELFGNSGTNTNQVCVQATDANGNTSPDWVCSSPFSVAAEEHSYYSFGGKLVAMRINGGAEQYLASDQVSSTSLVTSSTGTLVSQTRYTPYGQVRWNNQGNLNTDKSFTSQRDDGMGLMDYNARYYDSSLGRFISPDSIIPQPNSPLAWDRYGYVQNNPINFNDPTGHRPTCSPGEICDTVVDDYNFDHLPYNTQAKKYGFTFTGEWTISDQKTVLAAALNIGYKYKPNGSMGDITATVSSVFGGTELEHVNYSCKEGCWGRAISSEQVRFYGPSSGLLDPRLVVHELGHVFNARVTNIEGEGIDSPYTALDRTYSSDQQFPSRASEPNGFAGPLYGWQQSPEVTTGEEFADMFIGWIFNQWAYNAQGAARSNWMNQSDHMWNWTFMLWGSH